MTKLATGRGMHLAVYTTNSFCSNSWLISNLIFSGTSFWFEKAALAEHIDFLGADTVMFETDFPHGTSLTDRMTADVAATLATLTPEVRKQVLHDTAARVYNLP